MFSEGKHIWDYFMFLMFMHVLINTLLMKYRFDINFSVVCWPILIITFFEV